MIFENQSGGFTKSRLKSLAQQLEGIDQEQFATCLDTDQYRSVVEAESQEANLLNIRSTPSIVINGRLIRGAVAYTIFQDAIEQALAEAN